MFQDHESWGGSSRKPDLRVVSIIRNGKIIDDDFPERPCVAKKVGTALRNGSFDYEEVFLEQDSEYEDGQDFSSLSRTNSLCSEEGLWHCQESEKSEYEAGSEKGEQKRPREEEIEKELEEGKRKRRRECEV